MSTTTPTEPIVSSVAKCRNTSTQPPTRATTAKKGTCATVDLKSNVTRALGVPKASRIFAHLGHLAKKMLHSQNPVAQTVLLDSINCHVARRFVPSARPDIFHPRRHKQQAMLAKYARHRVKKNFSCCCFVYSFQDTCFLFT